MRFLTFLIPSVILATTIEMGSLPLLEVGGEFVFDPGSLNLVLSVVSDFLGYDPPVLDFEGETKKLIFNGNVLIFSNDGIFFNGRKVEEGFMRPDVILGAFGVPTKIFKDEIIIPECVLESIDVVSNSIRVSYIGNPAFDYISTGVSIEMVSSGYVIYKDRIYSPGEIIEEIPFEGVEISRILEYKDHDVVILSLLEKVRKLIIARYGSWKGRPIHVDDFLVLVGRGRGTVIIRPYTSDLKGIDVGAFERSKRIGKKIAEVLGYSFEICPLRELPVGGGAVAIFTNEDVEKIKKVIFEIVGYSDLDDRVDGAGE